MAQRGSRSDPQEPPHPAAEGAAAGAVDNSSSSAERLITHNTAAAAAAPGVHPFMSGDGTEREDNGLPLPQAAQASSASEQRRRRLPQRRASNPARLRLSELLSNNLVSAGNYATGRTIHPRTPDPSMPQACMPRIKHKAMTASLTLPLGKRQADRLKAAQINAGQERDVNADGVPETRLPWAVRPDVDFKIVNHKAWSTGVVAPVVAQVKEALGFGEWEVEASLSEMLLCEEDCFYSEGRECDESPGVFATLMFQMPSVVQGGVFTVFDPSSSPPESARSPVADAGNGSSASEDGGKGGRSVSFSGPNMYYVAFYTDCERQLSHVTKGNLLTLVYNLRRVSPPGGGRPSSSLRGAGRPGGAMSPTAMAMPAGERWDWAAADADFFAPGVAAAAPAPDNGVAAAAAADAAAAAAAAAAAPAAAASGGLAGIGSSPWANTGGLPGETAVATRSAASMHALWPRAEADAVRRRAAVFVNPPAVPQPASAEHIAEIVRAVRSWAAAAVAAGEGGGDDDVVVPSKLVVALSHHYPRPSSSSEGSGGGGSGLVGMSFLKGRDRAVCNLLRLARQALASDVAAMVSPEGGGSGGGGETAGAMEVDAEKVEGLGLGPAAAASPSTALDAGGGKEGGRSDGAGAATWNGGSGVRDDGAALEIFLTRLVVSYGSENEGAFTTGPLVPLQLGDPEAEVELPLWVEEGPTFQGLQLLPDQALPVDIATEVLHSGGPAALSDLEGSYAEAFARGPEAVEFLGRKVDKLWQLEDSPGAVALSGGGGGGEGRQARFYTRAAIVCWPRANRHAVQLDTRAVGGRFLARARQQLSLLDNTPPRPAAAAAAAVAGDVRLMTADVVALARQPDRWIRDEEETDLVFECLHRSEDPVSACRAVDAICSGICDPGFALRLPSRQPRPAATTGGGGGVPSTTTGAPPLDGDTPLVPVTMLFSRVFSLLDDLECWRLMSPQLRRLISLNPSAFAGAVIARAAIHSAPSGGERGLGQVEPVRAAGASGSCGNGGGGVDGEGFAPGWEGRHVGDGSGASSSSRCPSPTSPGPPAGKRPCFALAGDRMTGSTEGKERGIDGSGSAAAGGVSADSWRAVAGDVLASAMPDVARGRMQGVRGCCAVADWSCSSRAILGCDAACSPLPLMVRALQDVAGDIAAAHMVRDTFSWVVRGQRELEEAPGATLVERERRLDQLGSLVWSLGDLRRSLALPGEEVAGNSEAATGAAVAGGGGGSGSVGAGGASLMRVVVEQMEVHLVGVLDTAASMPLPECPFPSYKMDSGYVCEHAGCPAPGFEREEACGCCVTCMEVVKPFLDSPYECWTSWVPWAGTDGDKFSPAFYQRLGLQCAIEGGAVKAIVLTKPNGTMDIHDAMQPIRDALYLRDRALNLLTSANSLAWLHFDAEERLGHRGDPSGGGGSGGSGAGGGDDDGHGGGSGGGGGGGGGVDVDVGIGFGFDLGSGFYDGITMDFDAVAAAAADASSEDWHALEDSNDRREFVEGGGGGVEGVAVAANAARSTPGPTGLCCWEKECRASSSGSGSASPVSDGTLLQAAARAVDNAQAQAAAAATPGNCDCDLDSVSFCELNVCAAMDMAGPDAAAAEAGASSVPPSGKVLDPPDVGARACASHGGANGTSCTGAGRSGARRRFDRVEGVLVEKRVWEERGQTGEGTSGEKGKGQPPSFPGKGLAKLRATPADGGQGVRAARNGSAGLGVQGAAAAAVSGGGARHLFAAGAHTAHGGEPAAAPVSCCAAGAPAAAEQPLFNAALFEGQSPNNASSTVFPGKKAGAAAKTPAEEAVEAVAAAVAANGDDTSEGLEESGAGCIQS